MKSLYSGVYIWRIVLMKKEACCVGYLSGSRRELPIYFIGIIVFGLVATGYLDKYPWLILLFVILLEVVYLKIKPFEGVPDEMEAFPS